MNPTCRGASGVREALDDPEPVDLKKTPKAGNKPRPPMTPEQQALATHYLPLARRLAKPFKAAWAPYRDDFESAACLGLVHAAQTYDATKRVKFPTYARRRILGELRDVWRDMQLSGWRDRDNPPAVCHLGYALEEHGRVLCTTAQAPVGRDFDARDIVDHWLAKLPKPNAVVCRMVVLEEMTHRQVGDALDRSKSRVQRLHRDSLKMLNESFCWKNKTAHEDDLIKAPLTMREKANPDSPRPPDLPSGEVPAPEIIEP